MTVRGEHPPDRAPTASGVPPRQPPVPGRPRGPAADAGGDALTGVERDILDFERSWWRRPGAKEQAILDRFGVSAIRYYQRLNRLLDRPAALAHDPVLVRRLQRLRSARGRGTGGGAGLL